MAIRRRRVDRRKIPFADDDYGHYEGRQNNHEAPPNPYDNEVTSRFDKINNEAPPFFHDSEVTPDYDQNLNEGRPAARHDQNYEEAPFQHGWMLHDPEQAPKGSDQSCDVFKLSTHAAQ